MKRRVLIAFAFLALPITLLLTTNDTYSNPTGAPAGAAGAPADNNNTCARSGCHSGTAGTRDGMITTNIPSSGYVPGQLYTVTVSITEAGISKWGFQITPQTSSGAMQGTWSLEEPTRTKIVSTKYVTHTTAGNGGASGSTSWNIRWTAPAAGSGDVDFYAAVMASNGNGSTSGDQIFKDNLTVSEDLSASVSETNEVITSVFPNPVIENTIYVRSSGSVQGYELLDLRGSKVLSGQLNNESNVEINVEQIPAGIYVLKLQHAKGLSISRIIRR